VVWGTHRRRWGAATRVSRRRRSFSSSTSSRRQLAGGSGTPGTGGALRSGVIGGARTRGRGSLGPCLGGRGRWREPFQGRMAALYRREREHGARGSAGRARPVSATEGTRRSGLSAEGCGVLWGAAGALAGCGVVWCRGGK
jgi:hypothetical protein